MSVFGKQRLLSAATLMGTLPGMRFYFEGEVEGCLEHVPVSLRTQAEWTPNPLCIDIFGKILTITKDAVFHEGQWRLLEMSDTGDSTSGNLIAYEWFSSAISSTPARKVIAVNLSETASHAWVHFDSSLDAAKDYIFHDLLHDVRYPRKGSELRDHLFVGLEGFQAHLFDVTVASGSDEEKGKSNAS